MKNLLHRWFRRSGPKHYENFDLRISENGARYRAEVDAPEGEEVEFDCPFTLEELESLRTGHGAPCRDAHWINRPGTPQSFRESGSRLFRSVFQGDIAILWQERLRQADKAGAGVRLRLYFKHDSKVADWPWEYLFDPKRRFLALSIRTPVVRFSKSISPVRPLEVELPVRVLVVTADPAGHACLDVEREWKDLEHALGDLKGEVELERLPRATLEDLRRKLREPSRIPLHILHFIGHGAFEGDQKRGVLFFQDGRVTGDELATILSDHDDLRLVVLNACEGARSSDTDRFSGVAQGLIQGGIPAVIAMQSRITDCAAISFSGSFYEEIARGSSVDAALSEARKAILSQRHGSEWGIPVLLSRSPDCRLFVFPKRTSTSQWISKRRKVFLISFLLSGSVALWAALGPGSFVEQDLPRNPISNPPATPTGNTEGCPPSELLGLKFVRIDPGKLVMGSKRRLAGKKRVYEVEITRPYCMSATEVTQKQWEKVMRYNPSAQKGDGKFPVEMVSYEDSKKFVTELNRQEPGAGYGLPTEAQWQYGAQLEQIKDMDSGMMRVSFLSTATARVATGSTGRRQSRPSNPTSGASTTCTGTCPSGLRIGMPSIPGSRSLILKGRERERGGFGGEEVGKSLPITATRSSGIIPSQTLRRTTSVSVSSETPNLERAHSSSIARVRACGARDPA